MTSSNVRQVRLRWSGEGDVYHGGPDGGVQIGVDTDAVQGQSPMQLLLMGLAGCMAIDVRMILEKSRVPLDSMEVEAIGIRATEPPKRYLSIELVYRLAGPEEEHQSKLDRAIALSRDKYCSVMHTLAPDIDFDIRAERV